LHSQPLIPIGLGEFTGTKIPLRKISRNSIKDFCAVVNEQVGREVLRRRDYNVFWRPWGIALASSDDDRHGKYDMLVIANDEGNIVAFDSNPDHMNSYRGFSYANPSNNMHFPRNEVQFGNMVTNYRGDFWIVDKKGNRVFRHEHRWNGIENDFPYVGIYYVQQGRVHDCWLNDMKTDDKSDDRLYIVTDNPSRLLVVNPYFGDVATKENWTTREAKHSLRFGHPRVIGGLYNNKPQASNIDENIILTVDRNDRLCKILDDGETFLMVDRVWLPPGGKYSCIRTNEEGDIYLVDSLRNQILKYTEDLDFLYEVGDRGHTSGNKIGFRQVRGISVHEKEVFITETFDYENGIQRFQNIAKILEHSIYNVPYNGYNPQKCLAGIRPFPRAKFKLSEKCRVRLKIFERRFSTLDSNMTLEPVWVQDLDSLSSGWHDTAIVWDGKTKDGEILEDKVVFAITTHRYWPEGDDAVLEVLNLDYVPPEVEGAGDIRSSINTSSQNPFRLRVPLTETVHGWLNIVDATGDTIATMSDSAKPDDIRSRYQLVNFEWVPAGLDSCESFGARVTVEDLAGNRSEVDINAVTDRAFRNSSGGIVESAFFKTRSVISPVSDRYVVHSTKTGMNKLESYCDAIAGGGTPTDVRIEIFNTPGFTGDPVFADTIGTTVPVSIDWFGTDQSGERVPDGDYYVRISAESKPGYSVSSFDIPSFDPRITVKTAIPKVSLIGNSENVTFSKEGETFLHAGGNTRVGAQVTWPDFTPTDGSLVVEYHSVGSATRIVFADTVPAATVLEIEIPFADAGEAPTGVYGFSAYYIDTLGNRARDRREDTTVSQEGISVSRIFIDNSVPSLLVDLEKNVFTEPEPVTCFLFNNTYGVASQEDYTYTYSLSVTKPSGGVFVGKIAGIFPDGTDRIAYTIPEAEIAEDGAYTIKARLEDNFGKQSDTAFAFFYLNERPQEIGTNLQGRTISGKVYVTGSLGDPDISTTDRDYEFEGYTLLYKPGADNHPISLDSDILMDDGWKSSASLSSEPALFAPFHRQNAGNKLFPWSNKSVVPTNVQGYASVTYLNSDLLVDTTYTLLALTREKGTNRVQSARSNIEVDHSIDKSGISIGSFSAAKTSKGVSVSFTSSKPSHAVVVVAQYRNGEYVRKVNEYHVSTSEAAKSENIVWPYTDGLGNLVEDGTYRVLLAVEETGGVSLDYRVSSSISVDTDLRVANVSVSPNSIVFPPSPDAPVDQSTATVSFTSSKHCAAKLDIRYDGITYARVGPLELTRGGISSPKTLNWDGSGEGSIPYSDEGQPYEVYLTVTALDDTSDSYDTTLQLFRYSPEYENPGISKAGFELADPDTLHDQYRDATTLGTSDVLWKTRLSGSLLSTDSLMVNGTVLMSGKQEVYTWKTSGESNDFEIRVRKEMQELQEVTVKVRVTYYLRYDRDETFGCDKENLIRERIDTWTLGVPLNGGTRYPVYRNWRNYCELREDIVDGKDKCETCCGLRVFYHDPVIEIMNIYSGDTVANDLSKYFEVEYVSGYENGEPDGLFCIDGDESLAWYKPGIRLRPEYGLEDFVRYDTITSPDTIKPHRYNTLSAAEDTAGDYSESFYLADPWINYYYDIIKVPERGGIVLKNMSIPELGDTIDWAPTLINGLWGDSLRYWKMDSGKTVEQGTFRAPAEMLNTQSFPLRVDAYCNAYRKDTLHWPFPADTVPSLESDDGIPYDQIAYWTLDNVDPRASKDTPGKFDSIMVARVAHDSMITHPKEPLLKIPFSVTLHADSPSPVVATLWHGGYRNSRPVLAETIEATFDSSSSVAPPGVKFTLVDTPFHHVLIHHEPSVFPRDPWTSLKDPLLSAADKGYIHRRMGFSRNGFRYNSQESIRKVYRGLTDIDYGVGSIRDIETYPYSFWRSVFGEMIRNEAINYGDGTPLSEYETDVPGYNHISLQYVDGSPHTDLLIDSLNASGNDLFTLRHAPMPTPKRFVELKGNITYDGAPDTTYTIDYYETKTKTWNKYGPIAKKPVHFIPGDPDSENILGYWDVSRCNGQYVLKYEMRRSDSVEVRYQVVNIGEKLRLDALESQVVYSPYSKAQMRFPAGSAPKDPVSIIPIDPVEIGGVNSAVTALGPVVEILPTGQVFNDTAQPVISFNLTKDDIDSMGVPLDQLGLIHIYYVDEERGDLVPLETGLSRVIIRDTDTIPLPGDSTSHEPMQDGDVAVVSGPVKHASIYGFFNAAGGFSLNPLPHMVNRTIVGPVSGIGPKDANVTVYVSADSVRGSTDQTYTTTVGSYDGWRIDSVALPAEGKNYLFAVTTIDGKERVLQTTVIRDTRVPIVTGDFTPVYVNAEQGELYTFDVTTDERGAIFTNVLGVSNASGTEYPTPTEGRAPFTLAIPIVPGGLPGANIKMNVRAIDEAGNISDPHFKDIIVDTKSPVVYDIVVTRPGERSVSVSASVSDENALSQTCLSIVTHNGTTVAQTPCMSDTGKTAQVTGTLEIPREQLWEPLLVRVEARDRAGNIGHAEQPIGPDETEDYSQWNYSMEVPLRELEISEAVKGFPLLIRLDGSNFDFTQARPDGGDIRFADQQGTRLSFEIESWNNDKQKAALWVRVPEVTAAGDNNITMYWGKSDALYPRGGWRVWYDEYKAVYHMSVYADTAAYRERISPILETVYDNNDGTYTAIFGYLNPNPSTVVVAVGENNRFAYRGENALDKGQVTAFEPGRHQAAFAIEFDGSNLVWHLNNKTATAHADLAVDPGTFSKISPVLEKVLDNGDGTYTAWYGYSNPNDSYVYIPAGSDNRFAYHGNVNLDKGQPTVFIPGRMVNVFSVEFDGSHLVWRLNGKTSTASGGAAQPNEVVLISPVLERVEGDSVSGYTAHFGYYNPNSHEVTIPVGPDNGFTYQGTGEQDLDQPIDFAPGRVADNFTVEFDGSNLVWSLNGKTATASGEAAETGVAHEPVDPVLEQVVDNGNGTFTAAFGYLNPNEHSVQIDIGANNRFSYRGETGLAKGQPEEFLPGRHSFVFFVVFDGSNLVWTLNNRTETANGDAAQVPTSDHDVSPVLEHVAQNPDGTFTAWFGTHNPNDFVVTIPHGVDNRFTYQGKGVSDLGQPSFFAPGRTVSSFSVQFDGSNLVWYLNGHTATASGNVAELVSGQDGDVFDATANRNDGVNEGSSEISGLIGNARRFDGADDYISVPTDSSLTTPEAFTAMAWMKTTRETVEQTLVSKYTGTDGWHLAVGTDDVMFGHNETVDNSSAAIEPATWHHIAVTHDGTLSRMFFDGEMIAQQESNWDGSPLSAMLLLGRRLSGNPFEGTLDEIRVADRGFSADYINLCRANQMPRSHIVQLPPVTPTLALVRREQNLLDWSVSTGGEFIDSVRIERKNLDIGSAFTTIASPAHPVGLFRDTTVSCGVTWEYRIRSLFGQEVSPWSSAKQAATVRCHTPKDLFELIDVALDANGDPIDVDSADIIARFYTQPESGELLYTERFVRPIQHGYFRIRFGIQGEVRTTLLAHDAAYCEIEANGHIQPERIPITSGGIESIKNAFRLTGTGSPVDEADAPVGALYTDEDTRDLYVKYGLSNSDWERVD